MPFKQLVLPFDGYFASVFLNDFCNGLRLGTLIASPFAGTLMAIYTNHLFFAGCMACCFITCLLIPFAIEKE